MLLEKSKNNNFKVAQRPKIIKGNVVKPIQLKYKNADNIFLDILIVKKTKKCKQIHGANTDNMIQNKLKTR